MMGVKCASCGRFIPYSQLVDGGGAEFTYVPDSDRSEEEQFWTCKACATKSEEQRLYDEHMYQPDPRAVG